MPISSYLDRVEKQINVQKIKYILGFLASTNLKYLGFAYMKARQFKFHYYRSTIMTDCQISGSLYTQSIVTLRALSHHQRCTQHVARRHVLAGENSARPFDSILRARASGTAQKTNLSNTAWHVPHFFIHT